MYLKQIKINNFRLFENFKLILNPGLNLLVGENDSGKTALIDAIRYTLGTNCSEKNYLQESDFHKDSTHLSIQLKFVEVDKYAHIFVEHLTHEVDPADSKNRRSVLYVQLTGKLTRQEKRGYPYVISEIKSGRDGNGLMLNSEIRSFLATTYLKPLRDAEGELTSGKYSRLSQILNSSKELKTSAKRILNIFADANSKLSEDDALNNTSKKIEQLYLHNLIFEEDKSLLKAIIDISGIKNVEGMSEAEQRRHLRIIFEGLNLSLTKEKRKHGLGYNNLLFIAAELLLLEQELDNEFPLLLIEEPEAHLHPQLQMKLLQFILKSAKDKNKPDGIQCILSTHSPNLASKANPKDIILMKAGKAFSFRAGETMLIDEDYQFLEKFLDATKANLFFARGVILVEGEAENILIPTIARLLGRPLEDYAVSIVNVGSKAWKRFVKLFLRHDLDSSLEKWVPVKVAALCDLDLWPDCFEKKEGNPYGRKKITNKNKKRWKRNVSLLEHIEKLKGDFEMQNVKVCVSDEWTFEYCLAFFGLFDECFTALGKTRKEIERPAGTEEERATYIQIKADKTDFAYHMALLLAKQFEELVSEKLKQNLKYKNDKEQLKKEAANEFAIKLRDKLPLYIIEAIEHVTAPFSKDQRDEANATKF